MGKTQRKLSLEPLESRKLFAVVLVPDLAPIDVQAGLEINVPFSIDNAAGIRGASIQFSYEPSKLELISSSLQAGDVWEGKGIALSKVNEVDGEVTAFLFSTMELKAGKGDLIELAFKVRPGVSELATNDLRIESIRLNEGKLEVITLTASDSVAIGNLDPLNLVPFHSQHTTECAYLEESSAANEVVGVGQEIVSSSVSRSISILSHQIASQEIDLDFEPQRLDISRAVSDESDMPIDPASLEQIIPKIEVSTQYQPSSNTDVPMDDLETMLRRGKKR